jgi:hypothetical protein
MEAEKKVAMGLPGEHYKRIVSMMGKHRRLGVKIQGRSGLARFYFDDKQMMVDQWDKDGNKYTQEVYNINDMPIMDTYKDDMIARIKKDFPDKPDDVIEAEADILTVANDVMKSLVYKAGMAPDKALNLVKSTLNQDISTAEEVKKCLTE